MKIVRFLLGYIEYIIGIKIYLYGYLNGLQSSRKLEKECTDLIAKIETWNFNYPTNGFAFIKMTYLKLCNDLIKTELKTAA